MREWFWKLFDDMSPREVLLWCLAIIVVFWAGVFQLFR